jgi:hypothetical protein
MHNDSPLSRGLLLSSLPVAGALAATEDPVFAAMAKHLEAERAFTAALRDYAYNEAALLRSAAHTTRSSIR